MTTLLQELKKRRIELKLKQSDMLLRAGISRQQYQRLESKGNPRLDTLELVAKGLNSEIMLIPQEKVLAVKALLEDKDSITALDNTSTNTNNTEKTEESSLVNDPWQEIFEDD